MAFIVRDGLGLRLQAFGEDDVVTKAVNEALTDHETCSGCHSLCFDFGAHYGGYGITMAKLGETVIALEPVMTTFARLVSNAHLSNAGPRMLFVNAALVPDSELLPAADMRTKHAAPAGQTSMHLQDHDATETVRCIDLEGLLDAIGVLRVGTFRTSRVKMDIEGGEYAVLGHSAESVGTLFRVLSVCCGRISVHRTAGGEHDRLIGAIRDAVASEGGAWRADEDDPDTVIFWGLVR